MPPDSDLWDSKGGDGLRRKRGGGREGIEGRGRDGLRMKGEDWNGGRGWSREV